MAQPALNYQIATYNVCFDRDYENVLRFSSRDAQAAYFRLDTNFNGADFVNFNAVNLFNPRVVHRSTASNLNSLLMRNYAIVKDNAGSRYYFYFITEARQESGNIVTLDLQLDVFQTYYLDVDLTMCRINRAHLDRFVRGTGTEIKFNWANQYLYQREPLKDIPKIMFSRTRGTLYNYNFVDAVNDWLDSYVYGWVYVYIDPTAFSASPLSSVYTSIWYNGMRPIPLPCVVACAPITQRNKYIYFGIQDGETVTKGNSWAAGDLYNFIRDKGPYIYNVKVSPFPPFSNTTASGETLNIDGSDLVFLPSSIYGASYSIDTGASMYVMGRYDVINYRIRFNDTDLQYGEAHPITFASKSEIIGQRKSYKFNPKMMGGDYMEIVTTNGADQKYSYDMQKLNGERLTGIFSVPTPDVSRSYFYLYGGLYSSVYKDAYYGLTVSYDNTYPYAVDQLKAFLANNKNFYLQRDLTLTTQQIHNIAGAAQGAINSLGTGLSGGNATGGVINTVANYALGEWNRYAQWQQSEYQIDNMRNAPDSVRNINGNIFMNMAVNKPGFYIEYYDILETDRERVNDFMCMFGYSYGALGKPKDFDHTRKYYNYVQADLQEVCGNSGTVISLAVKDAFTRAFANGVRFWNMDSVTGQPTFDYSAENYELSLEAMT